MAPPFDATLGLARFTGDNLFENMFKHAEVFNKGLNSWVTSAATNMKSMFHYSRLFNSDITSWDVGSVTTFEAMFTNGYAFDQPIGVLAC